MCIYCILKAKFINSEFCENVGGFCVQKSEARENIFTSTAITLVSIYKLKLRGKSCTVRSIKLLKELNFMQKEV